ncbi:MAG: NAD(P)H-quinone oxidoreductase [Leptolyngbya sp.]|jgi:NAD(P)H-quinone oxidoreductase subunit N|uniref:NAD(P)H-quinone oxidoreductase subunit N n=1 Tax=Shackletoniella antarctica TaxID=268115 RepID=A0A2W4WNT2_9CYAN|nr:MAG: NAD(P)H-quinone oxidoreductase [Shackletoniella antarctica]PZV20428.1 MAG: NAD(P)H-quinone oxidoreductase [Leptolyngbya sp.]
MALLTTGKPFIKDLESNGAIAVRMPLEGGFEGRYERRLKAAGYETMNLTARGLGDVSAYLTAIHGVRPPHLGKKSTGSGAAVGYTYFIPPMLTYRLESLAPNAKGMVLWLIEGHILSRQELAYLVSLPTIEPRVKVVVEVGGDRYFSWEPLANLV